MKKLKLFLAITFFTLTISQSFSQEYQLEKNTITGIFDTPDKTKSEIFSSINKWISLNYNSAQNVVQLNDNEAGNIIVKGVNEVVYKNMMKEFYPNNQYMQDFNTIKFNHTMEINIKDDKFRVTYSLTDIVPETVMIGYEHINAMLFDLIDLTGLKEEPVFRYNNYIEETYKKALIGKKKREKMQEMTRPAFEQVNMDVIVAIKSNMESIAESVNSPIASDW